MNGRKSIRKGVFFSYHDQSNDNKRLTLIMLIFAFLLCPPFAFLFRYGGAPDFLFNSLIWSVLAFPIILLIGRLIPYFKTRIPVLYMGYFIILTTNACFEMYKTGFQPEDMIFFIGFFATLNFGLQRFYLSLVYSVYTLITFLVSTQLYSSAHEANFVAYNILLLCISVFLLVVYFGRNKLINNVEDHNRYLRRIVNNMGHGVLLFQYRGSEKSLIDYNQQANVIAENRSNEELDEWFEQVFQNIDPEEIQELNDDQHYEKEIVLSDQLVIALKVTRLSLKKGVYYVAVIQDVTQKMIENDRIRQNERKYKNLFIRNLTGVFTLDLEGNILECNPAFLRLFKEQDFNKIRLFPDLKEWNDLREQIFRKETVTNFHKVVRDVYDQEFYFVFNFYYDYELEKVEGNVVDITEITLSSKALQENEKKFRALYEESNDSIVVLDFDRVIDLNQRGESLLGKMSTEIVGRSLWDFTYNQSPELKKQYDQYFRQLKEQKSVRFSWIFAQKEVFIEAAVSIVELRIEDEVVYQCVIHDETERNRHINELESSKKTFESIIENTPEGFLIYRQNQFVFASSEFFRIMDMEPIPVEKLSLSESYFGKESEAIRQLINEQQQDKKTRQKQLKLPLADRNVELELSIVSIVFDGEEAVMLIIKDVALQNKLSKEKLRAEILAETNKRLEVEIEERKQIELKLESEYLRTKSLFDSSQNTLLITLSPDLKISDFNEPSKQYFEFQTLRELEQGLPFEEYFDQIISPIKLRYFKYQLSSVRKGKTHQFELKFINRNNEKKWVEIYLSPVMDVNKVLTEFSMVAHDITDKKNNEREMQLSLKEKEVLLKEVHHRVKNNLQIISSILNLQSSYIEDERILDIIEESRHRIRSMAIIHEKLYQNTNFSSINFRNYSRELVRNLISSYSYNKDLEVDLIEEVEMVELNLDQAIPCGLLINELITNSMKYAFTDRKKGQIFLELRNKNNNITLVVGDDGVGLPEDFDINQAESLGLQLVITLVEQLDGDIRLDRSGGIKYFITFEKQKL